MSPHQTESALTGPRWPSKAGDTEGSAFITEEGAFSGKLKPSLRYWPRFRRPRVPEGPGLSYAMPPPSTTSAEPEIHGAMPLHRKNVAIATSWGEPMRAMGRWAHSFLYASL